METMPRTADTPVDGRPPRREPGDVNPYVRWIHEHPDCLLPDPTPAELARRLAEADAALGSGGRLVVDLGCGSGNFLLARARARPRDRFVGFELRYKRLVKAARKLEREGLRNLWLLRAEAERCADFFAPGTVDEVHLNFPDPWPKRAHWKKRLVNPPFLDALARTLAPGGTFHLKTDHSGYFLHCLSVVRARPDFRLVGFANDLHRAGAQPDALRTEFEQLFRSQRKSIFYLALARRPAGKGA